MVADEQVRENLPQLSKLKRANGNLRRTWLALKTVKEQRRRFKISRKSDIFSSETGFHFYKVKKLNSTSVNRSDA